MVRDIRNSPRTDTVSRAGWRRKPWARPASINWDRISREARLTAIREKLARGETVYLAGLGAPGTHNSGVALVEVTQANGPRLIVNNEEERFSGNKHTTEYPKESIDAAVATLRGIGRDIGDIDAWLTSWDYPTLAGTLARSVLEELPQSLKLLRTTEAAGFDGRRLDQMTRTPKILARQLGLSERVPLICMPHHDNHAWFSYAASPFKDDGEPVAIAVLDGTGDLGSISLYVVENGAMRRLYCNDSMFDSLGAFYSVISSTQGGWTWLSCEGRYMGAAAWGDMNRATNPYYTRLRNVLIFGSGGEVFLNRAMANWYCDPFDNPYKPALTDILGPPLKPEQLWNPDAVLRVEDIHHRRRHQGSPRQGRRDAAGVRGRHDPRRRPSVARDGRDPAGADRRRGAERRRQYAAARAFRRSLVCRGTASEGAAASVGAAGARRSRRHHGRRLAIRASRRRPARRTDDTCVPLRVAAFAGRCCGSPRTPMASPRRVIGDISTPDGREAVADLMAFMVAQSGVIALYQGAAETGPRALGHRSIFANPCDPQARERLNERVKYREAIRPLAPMATLEAAQEYFELLPGASDANYNAYNYMVLTARSKPQARDKIPAVIHADGTGRIQIVRAEDDPLTYAYLKALGRRIGVEMSVNTSFNVAGPIAQTPKQAIETLRRSKGLDVVLLVADDGTVHAAWHGGERDSGRFTGWLSQWKSGRT